MKVNNYKKSGVDVNKAEQLVESIKKRFPYIGGYAGNFSIGPYKLAATCDGVGTKIKLAIQFNMHSVVGEDLVAMSVNDLIAGGAQPLFFLDYFSCSNLNENVFNEILKGIEIGLKKSNCILLGGEIAEMPDIYTGNDYDLAGFACGLNFKEFNKEEVKKGDMIIGLKSNGLHSNGFSLIRKLFSSIELEKYKELIMLPTRIYSEIVNSQEIIISSVKSAAHITGGGIVRALKRLLPDGLNGEIFPYPLQGIFKIIEKKGINRAELESVFNCGWGMFLIASEKDSDKVIKSIDGEIVGIVR